MADAVGPEPALSGGQVGALSYEPEKQIRKPLVEAASGADLQEGPLGVKRPLMM